MAKSKKPEHPLARALRSKIGKVCHFTNPETGEVIEGTYQRGRKVTRLTGMRRMTADELKQGADATGPAVSGFMLNEQTFTVPKSIKITMGPK